MTTTAPLSGGAAVAPAPDEHAAADSRLSIRLSALDALVELGSGRIDQQLLDDTAVLLDRAGERLRLSGDHTVVTLAGGTGSGKSSLFNAVCGLDLSPVGMRRPMTSLAHACVWGLDGAGPLLDWLAVDKRFRYARASALDRTVGGTGSLQGLVLLDLPDHDSIQALHRAEVDRFVAVADLLVWVVDPQKYADASLHRNYIVPFAQHAGVTLIVLNQVDRLQPEEVQECVSDLRRLLEAEGLSRPRILTTSAVADGGVDGFREVLVDTVAARRARVERLTADIDRLAERFAYFRVAAPPPAAIADERIITLIDALTGAAGASAVAEAMESAYELRATDYIGWPVAKAVARLRSDPLRKMRLTELRNELRGAFTGPVGAQQGDVDTALADITDGVAAELPEVWRLSVRDASRSHAAELPEALGASLKNALPTFNQVPGWWSAIRIWQYVLVLVAVIGLVWVALLTTYGAAGAGHAPSDLIGNAGLIPYVSVLVACALGMGPLTSSACRNVVALSSAKHGERMEAAMRERIIDVVERKILDPVNDELAACARYRDQVSVARGETPA
jgi:GTP-binding protein EngB required for normal cell division